MTRQEKRDSVFLAVAEKIAELGTCDRAQVGAVLTIDGRCVSWGFNGAPPGLPHCDENNHGYAVPCVRPDDMIHLPYGCKNATHAEANALAFAAKQGISTDGATCYTTMSPCDTCARLLIAAGIVRVVTNHIYRDTTGWSLLGNTLAEGVHIAPLT